MAAWTISAPATLPAGVREYWIIDPIRQRAQFNRLDDSGETHVYLPARPDAKDCYRTPLLPRLALHVPTLWLDDLPGIRATVQAVQTMLDDAA
jgi:Uma2 family endonuclease